MENEKDLTERDGTELPGSFGGFGELPEDLRGIGPSSITDFQVFEGDGYSTIGGSYRSFVEPIPSIASEIKFTAISYLPRQNYESFRSQMVFQKGNATLAPSSATTFTTLASITIPQGFSAVINGIGQWIGDSTAYQKPDGSVDSISWRLSIAGSAVSSLGSLSMMISTLENPGKVFFIVTENVTVELSATNSLVSGSFGARSIPVAGYFRGYQFPIDELDDNFRNR